jgi:hypothetical protein
MERTFKGWTFHEINKQILKSLIIAVFLLGLPELRIKAMSQMVPTHDAKILQFHYQISRTEQRLRNQFADDVYINHAITYHSNYFVHAPCYF